MSLTSPRSLHLEIHLSGGVCAHWGRVPGMVRCEKRNQKIGRKEEKDPEELA